MSKSKNKIILAIASMLAFLKAEGVKLEEVKTADGVTLFADKFEAGEPVFILQEEAQIPCPVGEYALEDGRTLVVSEEGIIGELKEKAAEEPPAPAAEEASKEKKMYSAEEIQKMISDALAVEAAKTEAVKAELTTLKTELATAKRVEPLSPSPEGGKTQEGQRVDLNAAPARRKPSSVERVMEMLAADN